MRYIWALTRKGGKHSYPSLNDLLATTIVFFLTIKWSVDSSSANATNVLNQSVNQTSQHQCMFNLTTVWPKVIALARNQNSLLLTIKPSALSHSLGILQYGMLKLFEAKSKWIGIYFQTQPKIKMILFRCQHFCSTLQISIFWVFFHCSAFSPHSSSVWEGKFIRSALQPRFRLCPDQGGKMWLNYSQAMRVHQVLSKKFVTFQPTPFF